MTFNQATPNWTNATSDANFRYWGKLVSDTLTAVGLPMTADTGQINWTTVLNPGGTGIYVGYEIRRFNDALQATVPVFFKIEYGESTFASDGPNMRVQFGTGSNGAGVLTGTLSALYLSDTGSRTSAGTFVGSGDSGRFVMCGGQGAASTGQFCSFERSKDANGNPTGEAILWTASTSGGAGQLCGVWSPTLGTLGVAEITLGALFPGGSTAASGAQTMVMPIFHNKGVFMNPGLNVVGYFTENITPLSNSPVFMYGAAHQYFFLAAGQGFAGTAFRGASSGGTESTAIRYE